MAKRHDEANSRTEAASADGICDSENDKNRARTWPSEPTTRNEALVLHPL